MWGDVCVCVWVYTSPLILCLVNNCYICARVILYAPPPLSAPHTCARCCRWFKVGSYPASTSSYDTFQLVFGSDGDRTFAILKYKAPMGWSAPAANSDNSSVPAPFALAGMVRDVLFRWNF